MHGDKDSQASLRVRSCTRVQNNGESFFVSCLLTRIAGLNIKVFMEMYSLFAPLYHNRWCQGTSLKYVLSDGEGVIEKAYEVSGVM